MPTIEEHLITKPIKDPYHRAFLNIMFTGVWLQQKMGQILKPFDITEPQYNVLRILRGQSGESMNLYEVQNRMIQKMSNVSRLIDKLVAKKLVTRRECKENRRRVDLTITQKGLDLLDTIEPKIEPFFKAMNEAITKEEAKNIGDWLDKMRNE
ncbi:MAG: MarR family transcriptional regulator [Chitinophagales bacterium]|nr:MarR family transcriptional regulator [Chitinophagales bacterium]